MRRVVFLYLGRTGAGARLAWEIAASAKADPNIEARFVLAEGMERAAEICALGADSLFWPTFTSGLGAITAVGRAHELGARLEAELRATQPCAVIEIMPHVWSPFLAPYIQRAGVPRAVLFHDASPHPGDTTALATEWLVRSALKADRIITMSAFVSDQIAKRSPRARERVRQLFHPDFSYAHPKAAAIEGAPLRILFLGRIAAYKGLDLLVDAVEILRGEGVDVRLSVFGSGSINAMKHRLAALDARIVNQWLSDDDISEALSANDILVAPYREASQSGVVAAALGAELPVIVTPVGGLPEQVGGGVGVVAESPSGPAIARAIRPLATDRAIVAAMAERIRATAPARSMRVFLPQVVDAACS